MLLQVISRFDTSIITRLGTSLLWNSNVPVQHVRTQNQLFTNNTIKTITDIIIFFYMYGFSNYFKIKSKFFIYTSHITLIKLQHLNFNSYYRTVKIFKTDFSGTYNKFIRRSSHLKFPLKLWLIFYNRELVIYWYLIKTFKTLPQQAHRRRYQKVLVSNLKNICKLIWIKNTTLTQFINFKTF